MEQQAIIDSIHGATVGIFSTMLSLDAVSGPARNETACPSVQDGVMSFVSLDGPWVGTGVMTCTSVVACRFSAAFLMMPEVPAMNEEVLDCIGELTNMIIGNFKTDAECLLGQLTLGVPTVIYGKNFMSRSMGGNDWLIMPFQCGADVFEIQIALRPAKEGSKLGHHTVLAVI
jgi:CheY-specific phosphatase CheX